MTLAEYIVHLQQIVEEHPHAADCQVVTSANAFGGEYTLRQSAGYSFGVAAQHRDGSVDFEPLLSEPASCQSAKAICLWP